LSQEDRDIAGITDNLIRVAAGLESVEDLKADLGRGLAAL
ncbi:PLP-dependent transferase, partial [Litorivivens sp.]